jgi:hypothetical protein
VASLSVKARPNLANCHMAGAGQRVSEMTHIRALDVDFSKDYLHVPAINDQQGFAFYQINVARL